MKLTVIKKQDEFLYEDFKRFCLDININIILDNEMNSCLLYCSKLKTVFLGDNVSPETYLSFVNNYTD